MSGVKLTKAQLRELTEMAAREYRSHYDSSYKPIVRLLELGFVDKQIGKYGSATYSITPAGRLALSQGGGE